VIGSAASAPTTGARARIAVMLKAFVVEKPPIDKHRGHPVVGAVEPADGERHRRTGHDGATAAARLCD
jgi:hypothetical protein